MTMSVANAIGPRDFGRGVQRALPTLASSRGAAEPVQDVLDHDDRRVDQQADGDRQPAQRHRVQPDAERLQQKAGERDRQRNRQRHDQGRAHVAEQHQNHEHDEHAAEHHRAADAAKRRRHELRLVVDDAQLDALRQRSSDVVDRARGCPRRRSRYPAPNCLMMRALTTSPFRRCAMPRRTAAASRMSATSPSSTGTSPRVVTTVRRRSSTRLRAAERAHRPFDRALGDDAARGVQVRFLDGVHHVVEADAPRGHALGIELHLKLPQVAAETLHGRHAGHGQQPVVDLELGEIAQRHQVRRAWLGFERELEDLVQPAGQAGDQRRIGPGGSCPTTCATRSATNCRER